MNDHSHELGQDLDRDVRVEWPQDGAAVVTFSGEHDAFAARTLELALSSLVAENELVVVDFSQAEFVDSSMIQLVLRSYKAARERGSAFRLQLGTAAIVDKAFQLSGALEVLDRCSTREEALRSGDELR